MPRFVSDLNSNMGGTILVQAQSHAPSPLSLRVPSTPRVVSHGGPADVKRWQWLKLEDVCMAARTLKGRWLVSHGRSILVPTSGRAEHRQSVFSAHPKTSIYIVECGSSPMLVMDMLDCQDKNTFMLSWSR